MTDTVPEKANRILHIILIVLVMIGLKVTFLTLFQHQSAKETSQKPRHRSLHEFTPRATIRDRFNQPLAINQTHYQAMITYNAIREIPTAAWETTSDGKKIRVYKRKEYIKKLSELLAQELSLDPQRTEDLIHSKAALYFHIPYVIKKELSEQEYYRLKMLEKDWPGLEANRCAKRVYPQGEIAGDILGYVGPIHRDKYEAIIREMRELRSTLHALEEGETPQLPKGMENSDAVKARLHHLEEKAYSYDDTIGRGGVEAQYEEDLRGYQGEKRYLSNAQGNILRELPGGHPPLTGKRIFLTLSTELQEYAEQLLVEHEKLRDKPSTPFIKGGAIVVLDPHTGDVLALASHPRSNPNDFIESGDFETQQKKTKQIHRWLESETHLEHLWHQLAPLERENYNPLSNTISTEQLFINWDRFIELILPPTSPVHNALDKIVTIDEALQIEEIWKQLITITQSNNPSSILSVLYRETPDAFSTRQHEEIAAQIASHPQEIASIKKQLDPYFTPLETDYNRLLFSDLCRLSIDGNRLSDALRTHIGQQHLDVYRQASTASYQLQKAFKPLLKELFHDEVFLPWREQHEKAFLKEKRELEKAQKRPSKPYIDLLDRQEKEMFDAYWADNHSMLIASLLLGTTDNSYLHTWHRELEQGAHSHLEWNASYKFLRTHLKHLPFPLVVEYLESLRNYHDLNRPLLGRYRNLRRDSQGRSLEKHLAAAFYPRYGYGFNRSFAYRQNTLQGSIFKIVTAYAALLQTYEKKKDHLRTPEELNPLTMIDRVYKENDTLYVGSRLDGTPIPRLYNGDRIPRTLATNLGKIDITKAISHSSNSYFALLAGDVLDSPQDLIDATLKFSYGSKTGIDLPGEVTGSLPPDLEYNKTGLYAFSIGHHSLVTTPLQTAVMLASLANGGKVLQPKIVYMQAGRSLQNNNDALFYREEYPHKNTLKKIGITFPLFTAPLSSEHAHAVSVIPPKVRHQINVPPPVRHLLFKGMHNLVVRMTEEGYWSLGKLYANNLNAPQSFKRLKQQLIGKTSSAESMEVINLDQEKGVQKETHIWFGAISFEDDSREKPELVVVVYLRHGNYGKDAAPLASLLVEKWREIKARMNTEMRL